MAEQTEAAPSGADPSATDRAADEAAIRSLVASLDAAWADHDADAWAALFTEDCDYVNILGMVLPGREGNRAQHAAIFATVYRNSRVTATVRRLRFFGPDLAVVDTDCALTGYEAVPPGLAPPPLPNGDPAPFRTRLKHIVIRQNGGWIIAASQNTAVLPPMTPR